MTTLRLRAKVSKVLGTVRHLAQSGVFPPPAYVEIIEAQPGVGFHLLHFAADGTPQADSWHETVDEAKKQAAFEFAIDDEDWETLK